MALLIPVIKQPLPTDVNLCQVVLQEIKRKNYDCILILFIIYSLNNLYAKS
ncbi:hypothetical protein Cri9333_0474 [Crinalium epipsammum PCC 9333]|uniref:Uncharacterized protein n=1 Tax=Crinalium epipsammum PCC 9333 TaxID=1173022 RepID=K9VWA1_9CYAN|nr:hypothetical protein Cri9333_0474 [Crinalium epipsammum PCC 9333]